VLEEGGVPCYPFPERAVRALAGMATLAERGRARRDRPAAPHASRRTRGWAFTGRRKLGLLDAAPVLEAYDIRCVRSLVASTPAEARRVAEDIGFPVALKIVAPSISHKTDVGGVRLGLRSADAVAEAMTSMTAHVAAVRPGTRIDGVLVQAMAPEAGHELLLGMVRDAQFGPLVTIGWGGIYVEVLADIATRLAPVDPAEALTMIGELRMAPALRGSRGQPPVDLEGLAAIITRFSELVSGAEELQELEINPLIVGPRGAVAVDVRGVVG
jgi:acetate---CoA ligase (ADP-forming)